MDFFTTVKSLLDVTVLLLSALAKTLIHWIKKIRQHTILTNKKEKIRFACKSDWDRGLTLGFRISE